MPDLTSRPQAAPAWRVLFERARVLLWPREVPAHPPVPQLTPREDWLRRLDRIRDLLEQTRRLLIMDGWTSGAWFSVADAAGPRRVDTATAFGLLHAATEPVSGCLVGTMLRLVENPDTAPSLTDAWACVDELYEAMHERMGHSSAAVGRIYSHDQHRAHLRALTAWNDEPGRQLDDVLDLVDRAISRTVIGACAPVGAR